MYNTASGSGAGWPQRVEDIFTCDLPTPARAKLQTPQIKAILHLAQLYCSYNAYLKKPQNHKPPQNQKTNPNKQPPPKTQNKQKTPLNPPKALNQTKSKQPLKKNKPTMTYLKCQSCKNLSFCKFPSLSHDELKDLIVAL